MAMPKRYFSYINKHNMEEQFLPLDYMNLSLPSTFAIAYAYASVKTNLDAKKKLIRATLNIHFK